MKKYICLLLVALLVLSLCACGKANTGDTSAATSAPAAAAPTTEAPSAPSETPVSEESLVDDPAWDQLDALGKVTTENGVFYVTMTVPAEMVGTETTQASLDAEAGGNYTSAKLNDDGSVTYKMTKKQHKAMMDEFTKTIEEGLQEMVDSPDYAFTKIIHNADYTSFDAHLSTNEVGMTEGFMSFVFYMYGGFYSLFSGKEIDNVAVNFYAPDGSLISTVNSSEMGNLD